MIDDARPALANSGQHVAEIADVAADEIEAVGVGGEPTLGAGAAVEDGEALFFFEQRRHERPPDETGAAGDEDTASFCHAAMVAAGARKGNRRLGFNHPARRVFLGYKRSAECLAHNWDAKTRQQ